LNSSVKSETKQIKTNKQKNPTNQTIQNTVTKTKVKNPISVRTQTKRVPACNLKGAINVKITDYDALCHTTLRMK
jgi:hypothetical protein